MAKRTVVPGVLFLYEDPLRKDATTILEHIDAFLRLSRFDWYPVNIAFGLPAALSRYTFAAVVFHYSIRPTYRWLERALQMSLFADDSYKVAIFQDEIWHFAERDRLLTELRIDCLYSRHKPNHVRDIYGAHLPVNTFVHYLAGYVSDDLVERATRLVKPYAERPVDVGYRGRRLPYHFGRGGQEKGEIADRFIEKSAGQALRLDVASGESDRLYGSDWDSFLANCKSMLGVEGGVSVVDRSGRFRSEFERMIRERPNLTYAQFTAAMGPEFEAAEDRIDYRSLTPRHFESAAFRNLQILFEGRYDGILEPWTHYVPLRKDFSNLSEVLGVLRDSTRATEITDRAYVDLIASGAFSYRRFLESFDRQLAGAVRLSLGPVPRELDRDLREYLEEWHRCQSRAFDFDSRLSHRFVQCPEQGRYLENASQLLAAYRRAMDQRKPGRRSPLATWLRKAADRSFWAQAERWLGTPIPPRPEFDPEAAPRTFTEKLVTMPLAAFRMATIVMRRLFRFGTRNVRKWVGPRERIQ